MFWDKVESHSYFLETETGEPKIESGQDANADPNAPEISNVGKYMMDRAILTTRRLLEDYRVDNQYDKWKDKLIQYNAFIKPVKDVDHSQKWQNVRPTTGFIVDEFDFSKRKIQITRKSGEAIFKVEVTRHVCFRMIQRNISLHLIVKILLWGKLIKVDGDGRNFALWDPFTNICIDCLKLSQGNYLLKTVRSKHVYSALTQRNRHASYLGITNVKPVPYFLRNNGSVDEEKNNYYCYAFIGPFLGLHGLKTLYNENLFDAFRVVCDPTNIQSGPEQLNAIGNMSACGFWQEVT